MIGVVNKYADELYQEYFVRLFENKVTYGLTCQQIADLLNAENGEDYTESKYRKEWVSFNRGREYERTACYDQNVRIQLQELKREKTKLSDERMDLNRQLRNQARLEDRFEKLEYAITASGVEKFDISPAVSISGDNDLLVCLSDLHIGATYLSPFGRYNTEIAKMRLEEYLKQLLLIQKTHNSESCHVCLLGDAVSGDIHFSLSVSNAENVIEQVKIASELVSNFVYELSRHFKMVYVASVNGNHSRLGKKEDSIKDVRLDEFLPWYIKGTLEHIPNVYVIETKIDSTIAATTIRGLHYVLVHGDYDSFSEPAIAKLVMMLEFKPYAVVFGHKHTCAIGDASGIKMIRSGSLGGSGDDFTITHRMIGNPSQMVCVCNSKGVSAYYPVEFE